MAITFILNDVNASAGAQVTGINFTDGTGGTRIPTSLSLPH
jgi:hypothetical protein